MMTKNSTLVKDFKEGFVKRFEELGPKLGHQERMKIATALNKHLSSINRYLDGGLKELRRLELAEDILRVAKEVLRQKEEEKAAAAASV